MTPSKTPQYGCGEKVQVVTRCVADPCGILSDRVEDGLLVIARARDDMQDLSCRRLAHQRILKRGVIANLCL